LASARERAIGDLPALGNRTTGAVMPRVQLPPARPARPAITGLYCSEIGHPCTNEQMRDINRKRIYPQCSHETVELYEKLL
jgi:hypothetical protein